MTWPILLLIFLILSTASFLIRRQLAQSLPSHNRLINAFYFVVFLYPTGLLIAVFTAPNLLIGWTNLLTLALISTIFPLSNLLAFKSSKDVDAGLFTILSNLTPIFILMFAYLLLNERLSWIQLIGSMVIIASAFLVMLPNVHIKSVKISIGIIPALLSIGLLGVGIVFERYMLIRVDFGAYLVYGWGFQTFWLIVVSLKDIKNLKLLVKHKNIGKVVQYGIVSTLMSISFIGALFLSGSASLVGVYSSFLPIFVVIAAWHYLKEKDGLWIKILAAVIGTVGLIILNLPK